MSASYDRTNATILVVHYLGDGQAPVQSTDEMFKRANPAHPGYPNGYDYPEYEYGIIADGTIVPMRPLTVRGAHCMSDIPEMMHDDPLWWNKNSISIVIGVGDGYSPTDLQIKSLSWFVKKWISIPGHIVYRHNQVTYTDCPNLSLDVWNGLFEEEEKKVKNLIVYAEGDLATALLLSYKLGAPIINKDFATKDILDSAENRHHIGMSGVNSQGDYYYAGSDRIDTAKKVL